LAERLAAFTASLSFDALPDEVVDSVRMRALDVLGIALASSRGDWAPAVVDLAGEGGGECTVLGTARTASIPFAILVNGTLAHGLAGSFASGVMEHLEDGSWVKRLHPGWAGHSGAIAAALARGGVPGPATILEGRFGFYRTFVGAEPDRRPFETLGREWEILK